MNVKPLFDRVVIKNVETEEVTKGGIVLPGSAKEKPQMAEVLAVGPGGMVDGKTTAMCVSVGQKIIYSKYAGTEVKIDGEELMAQANAMKFSGNADFNVFETTDVKTYFLYFNCGELSVCSDENLRKAIAYAINVDDLITATGGTGKKAYTFGSPQYADYDQNWANEDYYEYNIETAKKYLADSNYKGEELRLFMSNGDENNKIIANLIQANCLEAGINIRIDGVDSASFSSSAFDPTVQDLRLDCKGFENLADLWKQDMGVVKSITDSADNKLNHVFLHDEELEALVDGMRFDDNHTAENIEACKEYINDNMFAYGIFSKNIYDVTSQKIKTLERTTKLYILPGACEYDWTK